MTPNKIKPDFRRTIKKTGRVILGFMLLNVVKNFIFQRSYATSLVETFLRSGYKVQGILLFVTTSLLVWGMLSLVLGTLSYGIQTVCYKTKSDQKMKSN